MWLLFRLFEGVPEAVEEFGLEAELAALRARGLVAVDRAVTPAGDALLDRLREARQARIQALLSDWAAGAAPGDPRDRRQAHPLAGRAAARAGARQLRPVMPSPISLAPMIRQSTIMMAALWAVIQSRRLARMPAARSPMPK